jgi:hypothetical protein
MKKILIILVLFFAFKSTFSQTVPPSPYTSMTANWYKYNNYITWEKLSIMGLIDTIGKPYRAGGFGAWIESGDTAKLMFYDGVKWKEVTGGSGGSGGSQDLQSVTDIGNTTTNTIQFNGTYSNIIFDQYQSFNAPVYTIQGYNSGFTTRNSYFNINNNGAWAKTGNITANSLLHARGNFFTDTLQAHANNDTLTGEEIRPVFTDNGFTGVTHFGLISRGDEYINGQEIISGLSGNSNRLVWNDNNGLLYNTTMQVVADSLQPYLLSGDTSFTWSVDSTVNTPPVGTASGSKVRVGTSPTGVFIGHDNQIATSDGVGGFTYETAAAGDLLYDANTDLVSKFNGSVWSVVGKAAIHQGGDSYGAIVKAGTNDNFAFQIRTNAQTRVVVNTSGSIVLNSYTGTGNTLMQIGSNGGLSRLTGSTGSFPYFSATNVISNFPIGTLGQHLVVGPSNTLLWVDTAVVGGSGVTTFSAGTTGFTPNSATSGAVTLAGTLVLANGGTNANLTASDGGIFYSTASAGAILAGTATANKILYSGASAAPSWSTPTFPVTASATSGKIIISDGTNWIASTPTYPSAAGSNGNVLTSDGTNWTSAAPAAGGVTTVGAFSGSSQTNGASISGSTITFGPSDGTNPGMVSTGTQTIAGDKTFTGSGTFNSTLFFRGLTNGSNTADSLVTINGNQVYKLNMSLASPWFRGTLSGASATTNIIQPRTIADTIVTGGTDVTALGGTSPLFKFNHSGTFGIFRNSIGAGLSYGLNLMNTTAAANGAQQYSPAVRWSGASWKSNATAISQQHDFTLYMVTTQGTTQSTAYMSLGYGFNGGTPNQSILNMGPAGGNYGSVAIGQAPSLTSVLSFGFNGSATRYVDANVSDGITTAGSAGGAATFIAVNGVAGLSAQSYNSSSTHTGVYGAIGSQNASLPVSPGLVQGVQGEIAIGTGTASNNITFAVGTTGSITLGNANARSITTGYGLRSYLTFGEASPTGKLTTWVGLNIDTAVSVGITGTNYGIRQVGTNATNQLNGTLTLWGKLTQDNTLTAAGTTGAQTINKPTGSVNLAIGAASLVVTNSLVSTSSLVFIQVMSNDATTQHCQVVTASGSFTIYPNAVPTAETKVAFWVIN